MPAPDSHLTLDEVEKATLIRWIEQGAEWKPHWSFVPPVIPAVPAVRTSGWPRGEIDRFVLAALEAKGWKPSPEAPRETWLRRVSFDLTGLPPTPADDRRVPRRSRSGCLRARGRSPAGLAGLRRAHGRRLAGHRALRRFARLPGRRHARDVAVARLGHFGLQPQPAVDDFITWQLAGDLLPDATQEQRIATAFNRNHMQSQEGGIVAEEYRTEYVVDRVNTLGRARPRPDASSARAATTTSTIRSRSASSTGSTRSSTTSTRSARSRTRRAEPHDHRHDARGRREAGGIGGADRDARSGARSGGRDLRHRLRALARDGGRCVARGDCQPARADRALPLRGAASGDRAAQGQSEEAAGAGEAARGQAGDQEAAQADPRARQRRGRQGARPRRRRRPPDEDRARQGRRRAAAGRGQLHRSRQESGLLRAQRTVLGQPVDPRRSGRDRPDRCSPARAP